MNAPGPPGDRSPAGRGAPGIVDTVPRLRREPQPLAPWPPEPFPGSDEEPTIRPAPVRVLTTKVAVPPSGTPAVRPAAKAEPVPATAAAPGRASAVATPAAPVLTAVAPIGREHSWRPRRSGRRRNLVLMIALLALAGTVGGLVALVVTDRDADHGGVLDPTSVHLATTVATTAAATTTTAASTTVASTLPTGPNVLGLANGTPADPASALPQERFAAHLGHDETAATPGSPALAYAMWWELFEGVPTGVVASPNGFQFDDRNGQTIELSGFALGADGQVADLVECVRAGASTPVCNQLGSVVSVDPAAPVVGQSASVTFTRSAEMRLLRSFVVHFVTMTAAKPVSAVSAAAAEVRSNDHVVAITLPVATVPSTVDLTVTYTDGTTETVTVTV